LRYRRVDEFLEVFVVSQIAGGRLELGGVVGFGTSTARPAFP
jgi:hypothetical protein